jgi:hypothetical protein
MCWQACSHTLTWLRSHGQEKQRRYRMESWHFGMPCIHALLLESAGALQPHVIPRPFRPPSAPLLLEGSSIRADKTIRDISRQNRAERRTQTRRRTRMYARKRRWVQSRSSLRPVLVVHP